MSGSESTELELSELDDNRRAVLAAELVAGRPYNEIAADLGVHRHTVRRWRQDTELIGAVARARTEVLSGVVGALTTSALDSVRVIEEIRDDPEASNSDRMRAASTLLSESRAAHQTIEHEHRLADLEDAAERIANNKRELTP